MPIAKIFMTGRSQAVRLPLEFRFSKAEVYINRNELTGDVVLSTRPNTWDAFFAIDARVPSNFLSEDERAQGEHRDLLGDVA